MRHGFGPRSDHVNKELKRLGAVQSKRVDADLSRKCPTPQVAHRVNRRCRCAPERGDEEALRAHLSAAPTRGSARPAAVWSDVVKERGIRSRISCKAHRGGVGCQPNVSVTANIAIPGEFVVPVASMSFLRTAPGRSLTSETRV